MKPLEAMTVAELRQHARSLGLSSVTRLERRAALVAAIRRMQQRYPDRYPPTEPTTAARDSVGIDSHEGSDHGPV